MLAVSGEITHSRKPVGTSYQYERTIYELLECSTTRRQPTVESSTDSHVSAIIIHAREYIDNN
jgi:hypothetical protein